jgi:hypothetical protein
LCKNHAPRGRQHLRIANAWDRIPCRHQNGAGHDRSGERGKANLINADDGTFRMTVA